MFDVTGPQGAVPVTTVLNLLPFIAGVMPVRVSVFVVAPPKIPPLLTLVQVVPPSVLICH